VEKHDLFKLIKYSFVMAITMFVVFILSFMMVFHIFFVVDTTEAMQVGNLSIKGGDVEVNGTCAANGTQRIITRVEGDIGHFFIVYYVDVTFECGVVVCISEEGSYRIE